MTFDLISLRGRTSLTLHDLVVTRSVAICIMYVTIPRELHLFYTEMCTICQLVDRSRKQLFSFTFKGNSMVFLPGIVNNSTSRAFLQLQDDPSEVPRFFPPIDCKM